MVVDWVVVEWVVVAVVEAVVVEAVVEAVGEKGKEEEVAPAKEVVTAQGEAVEMGEGDWEGGLV